MKLGNAVVKTYNFWALNKTTFVPYEQGIGSLHRNALLSLALYANLRELVNCSIKSYVYLLSAIVCFSIQII